MPIERAWEPLPRREWDGTAAAHLLRRCGWTASPEHIAQAVQKGPDETFNRLFPAQPPLWPRPQSIADLAALAPALAAEVKAATGDAKREKERQLRERERAAIIDLSLKWLAYAAEPANSAFAKWTLFLSDVYVVSAEKVRNAPLICDHFDIIARHALGPAPTLTRAVSRSPAMVLYLDLNQSQRDAPNENFARELFELFVLGEGNYTEHDIKEAARAFTGYRAQPWLEEFKFAPRQHDASTKTVFGQSGRFSGDDVIDLAYRQAGARTFLPHEMVKFYLSDTPLPAEYLAAIGDQWRAAGFDLRWLAHRFFLSQLFFAPEFRGNFIKSPVQFYLGLIQDLDLAVAPLPRANLNPLRQMGQWLFFPPNVRGWVGGRNWINSATITARRQLVEMLFAPINERALNADEQRELSEARAHTTKPFVADESRFSGLATEPPDRAATNLCEMLLGPGANSIARTITPFLASASGNHERMTRRLYRAAATLLQSPEYQLT